MKRKNKIVAIQGDLINTLNPKTDTTLLLALEAQRRDYKIYYYAVSYTHLTLPTKA